MSLDAPPPLPGGPRRTPAAGFVDVLGKLSVLLAVLGVLYALVQLVVVLLIPASFLDGSWDGNNEHLPALPDLLRWLLHNLLPLAWATLLFALLALRWPGPLPAAGPVPSLLLLVAVAGGLLAAARHGQRGLFPWQQWRRRWLALGLLVAVPLLLAALLYLQPGWGRVIWPLVALSVFAGTVAERLPPR